MDLIHPSSKADVVEAVRDANATARRLLVVGGRRHLDKGNPSEVDAELWTTQLDRLVAYEPAEMIAVVEAGMRVGELDRILAEGGQEWPSDAPADATVGGVIASGASSPRRLKVGALRDTVLEAEVVTGDGRLVRSGARTVKNVTGYDLHKLVAGSLGTLAVIVQVALKLRPLPRARRTLRFDGDLELADELVGAVHGSAAVLATPGAVDVRLEGWPEEVEEQTASARQVLRPVAIGGRRAVPARAAVGGVSGRRGGGVPSLEARRSADRRRLGRARRRRARVGRVWRRRTASSTSSASRVHAVGGIAPVVRGAGRSRRPARRRAGRAAPAQGSVRPERRARARPRLGSSEG